MHPLSFIIAFGFLAILGLLGVLLLVVSSRRLLRLVHIAEASGERAYPLAVVIPFGFLGILGILVASLAAVGSRRLFRLVRSPLDGAPAWHHAGEARASAWMAVDTVLLVLGFALLSLALMGVYRLIWIV